MKFDPLSYKYPGRRQVVYAKKGLVATSEPLAAQAGLWMLQHGGNAVDAAVAAAACLTVVEPSGTGVGGDAFCLAWIDGKLHGLNASGPAPQQMSIAELRRRGHETMPPAGWPTVTVPGAPAAWAELIRRFGRLPLTTVMTPAIAYADQGYPVAPDTSAAWDEQYHRYLKQAHGAEFAPWFDTFAPQGRAPAAGETWRCPDLARSLQLIAESEAQSFYQGELAEQIDAFSRAGDGFLRAEDLADYQPQWVEPISVNYRGYDVWEIPPSGQGMVALLALNTLSGYDFAEKESVHTFHRQIEAMKLAFADGRKYICDPDRVPVPVAELLSFDHGAARRAAIGDRAQLPQPADPLLGGTVYLAVADDQGNMVSFIQSNYTGSALVVPGTGIALHSRALGFSLDPDHANALEPGKRPYHTIIPGFVTKGQVPIGPFGIMGGPMQPQAHVQVMMNAIDFQLNPQSALDAPRWQWIENNVVEIEKQFPDHIALELLRRGHEVRVNLDPGPFGRGQIIWRLEDGTYCAGTESRSDGTIAVW